MEPISRIDVASNQLFFRGFDAVQLSKNYDYESVLHLLINGKLPANSEHRKLTQRIIELRKYYQNDVLSLEDLVHRLDRIRDENRLDTFDALLTFISLAPLVVVYKFGKDCSRQIEQPNSSLGHAANILWMARSARPDEMSLRDFQTSLILHMDDPLNPSLSALDAAIQDGKSFSDALLAALATHVGPLHHGAGTEAMSMFMELKNLKKPREYLEKRVDSGGKLFGLGHRIYQRKDPRAAVLEEILERRAPNTPNDWLLHVIALVTRDGYLILKDRKGVEAHPNVDMYNAAVYSTFGFPPEMNTELFAVSRAAGWIAHLLESHAY